MKTITEFFGPSLMTASKKYAELIASKSEEAKAAIIAEGKAESDITPEMVAEKSREISKIQLGAELKLEGEKLEWFLASAEFAVKERGRVKRALVLAPIKEGEKPQTKCYERDGKFFQFEFFPEAESQKSPNRSRESSSRGDGRRGGREGRGADRKRSDRGGNDRRPTNFPSNGDRSERRSEGFRKSENAPSNTLGPEAGNRQSEGRPPRGPRRPRKDARPPRVAKFDVTAVDAAIATEPPYLGINRIVPKARDKQQSAEGT